MALNVDLVFTVGFLLHRKVSAYCSWSWYTDMNTTPNGWLFSENGEFQDGRTFEIY